MLVWYAGVVAWYAGEEAQPICTLVVTMNSYPSKSAVFSSLYFNNRIFPELPTNASDVDDGLFLSY